MTRLISELDFHTEPFEWTIERYRNAIDAGVLTEEDAVELIQPPYKALESTSANAPGVLAKGVIPISVSSAAISLS